MMANPLLINNERSQDKPSLQEIPMMKHCSGLSLIWTPEEDKRLHYGLACFPPDSSSPLKRYKNIAQFIVNKNIRDVALRYRYIEEKDQAKRIKRHHNGLGGANFDQPSNPTVHVFDNYEITNELLISNKQYFDVISANFKAFKLKENILLFSKSVESIRKIFNKLRDFIEEMVKFTLDYRVEFDLELTGDFCSSLLADDSLPLADTVKAFAGVPDYPLYKRLVLGLLESIDSGSFCGTFEKVSLVKEVSWLKESEEEWSKLIIQKGSELVNALKDIACELTVQEPLFSLVKDGIKTVEARCFEAEYDRLQRRGSMVMINKCLMFEVLEVHQFSSFYELLENESPEKVFPGIKTVEEGLQMFRKLYDLDQERINGVVAIHLTKSVAQPCIALAHILSGLSYIGVQSLLGLSHTTGSVLDALPPPRSVLFSSYMIPYKPKIKGCRLSHGARALAKHVDRSSDGFWGVLHGTDSDKNRIAMDIINRFICHCCWMNIHIVPPHGEVFEIRVAQGYGARWSRDGTKFIGFLEPYTKDGHSMAWKH